MNANADQILANQLEGTASRTHFQTKIASEHWVNIGGKDFRLVGKSVRIGRAPDNDIVIDHKSASRYHALITISNDRVILEDLKSRNGIRVNGVPVRRAEMKDNDILRVGDLQGIFFQRAKRGGQKKKTVAGFTSVTTNIFSFENLETIFTELKSKASEIVENVQAMDQRKRRNLALLGVIGFLAAAYMLMSSGSSEYSSLQSTTASVLPTEQLIDGALDRRQMERCTEHEDLGNYRQAIRCWKALPNTAERRVALERVQASQKELVEKRFNEGQQALDYYYYDIAILKFQEVAMIADEDSEILSQAHANIMLAEQRKKLR